MRFWVKKSIFEFLFLFLNVCLTVFQMTPTRAKRACPECGTEVRKLAQHMRKVHAIHKDLALLVSKTCKPSRTSNRRLRRVCPVKNCLGYTAYLARHLRETHGLTLSRKAREAMHNKNLGMFLLFLLLLLLFEDSSCSLVTVKNANFLRIS